MVLTVYIFSLWSNQFLLDLLVFYLYLPLIDLSFLTSHKPFFFNSVRAVLKGLKANYKFSHERSEGAMGTKYTCFHCLYSPEGLWGVDQLYSPITIRLTIANDDIPKLNGHRRMRLKIS